MNRVNYDNTAAGVHLTSWASFPSFIPSLIPMPHFRASFPYLTPMPDSHAWFLCCNSLHRMRLQGCRRAATCVLPYQYIAPDLLRKIDILQYINVELSRRQARVRNVDYWAWRYNCTSFKFTYSIQTSDALFGLVFKSIPVRLSVLQYMDILIYCCSSSCKCNYPTSITSQESKEARQNAVIHS